MLGDGGRRRRMLDLQSLPVLLGQRLVIGDFANQICH
jgi:hypothetical protein